jgi:hypothetical protein
MERVLIGLLVLGFMLGTMLVAARLAVPRPKIGQDPEQAQAAPQTQAEPEPVEFAGLVDTALRSALD